MADLPIGEASLSWGQLPSGPGSESLKSVGEAAREFEALLIGQMLKSAREADGSEGWLGTGQDSSGTSVLEFAEQQFAQLMASGGGLGLAKMVTQGLSPSASGSNAQR